MAGAVDRGFEAVRIVETNVCMGGNWLAAARGDAPVCTCKIDEGVERGCEEGCLNRSMRVECAIETCPCGDRCCNRQLQVGTSVATAVIDCGRKGVGVIALEDVIEGCLVGEYVGELLGRQDAQLRSQLYRDARHSYMMQINTDAVIDATRIGGRMRFVNHSCDPNCQVEKWCVRGQERCGVFAIRRVTAGDELTFNYNFHSVNGEGFECLCGARWCQGAIGAQNRKQHAEGQPHQPPPTKKRFVQLTLDHFLQP